MHSEIIQESCRRKNQDWLKPRFLKMALVRRGGVSQSPSAKDQGSGPLSAPNGLSSARKDSRPLWALVSSPV